VGAKIGIFYLCIVNRDEYIGDFSRLGGMVESFLEKESSLPILDWAIRQSLGTNVWFTKYHIHKALRAIAHHYLCAQKLNAWLANYSDTGYGYKKEITVVMAGNIPLAGYHDYLSVLASGRKVAVKLSSKDSFLLPALHQLLCSFAPAWGSRVRYVTEVPIDADGLIASGSDATAAWYSARFSHLPKVIRGHRVSAAVIPANITQAQITALHSDMFLYFGLGCRSVVHLFIPMGFDLDKLTAFEHLPQEASHVGFQNAYRRQKALLTLQKRSFIDGKFFLLQPMDNLYPPMATIYYTYYQEINDVQHYLETYACQLQCVVGRSEDIKNCITFGCAQTPQLWDYADGIDTMML
jgi:hypothetical protein